MQFIKEAIEATRRALMNRQRSYQTTFAGVEAEAVLRDLAKFCRAGKSAFHQDPRLHAHLQGRQEVWLRIQQHLNLTPERLYDLYGGPKDDGTST